MNRTPKHPTSRNAAVLLPRGVGFGVWRGAGSPVERPPCACPLTLAGLTHRPHHRRPHKPDTDLFHKVHTLPHRTDPLAAAHEHAFGGGARPQKRRYVHPALAHFRGGPVLVREEVIQELPCVHCHAIAWGIMACVLRRGGGVGMTPWCVVLVCSWRRLLADRHSLSFPWTLSLHRRWCPSASHHPLTFLFLHALTFPLPFPFPSLGLSLRRPQCPSASHHSFPSHSLGRSEGGGGGVAMGSAQVGTCGRCWFVRGALSAVFGSTDGGETSFYSVRVGPSALRCCFCPLASLPHRRRQCCTGFLSVFCH